VRVVATTTAVYVTARESDALLEFSAQDRVSDPGAALEASVTVGEAPVDLAHHPGPRHSGSQWICEIRRVPPGHGAQSRWQDPRREQLRLSATRNGQGQHSAVRRATRNPWLRAKRSAGNLRALATPLSVDWYRSSGVPHHRLSGRVLQMLVELENNPINPTSAGCIVCQLGRTPSWTRSMIPSFPPMR
jgi:hypothetical protein